MSVMQYDKDLALKTKKGKSQRSQAASKKLEKTMKWMLA